VQEENLDKGAIPNTNDWGDGNPKAYGVPSIQTFEGVKIQGKVESEKRRLSRIFHPICAMPIWGKEPNLQ